MGVFKTSAELWPAVRAWAEARHLERTGTEWNGPSLDDPSIGTGEIHAAIARGEWAPGPERLSHKQRIDHERRAREALEDLRAALVHIRDLLPDSWASDMGGECFNALWQLWNGWRSPVTLPDLLGAYPWILDGAHSWRPDLPGPRLDERAFVVQLAPLFGYRNATDSDLAALSLLAGNKPELPDGWRLIGLTVQDVLKRERAAFKQRKRRDREKHPDTDRVRKRPVLRTVYRH